MFEKNDPTRFWDACWESIATTPKVLARSRMFLKLYWLPALSASTNKSMAAVSPNSLSVRSRAGKWCKGWCWLSHTSHRSCSAARTAAALPPVTRKSSLLLSGQIRLQLVSGSNSKSRGRKCLSRCWAQSIF